MPRPSAPSPVIDPRGRRRLRAHSLAFGLAIGLAIGPRPIPPLASASDSPAPSLRPGAPGMLQPHTGSLLVDYYEAYLRDRDIDAFRRNVSARYNEGTLSRLLGAPDVQSRRASVLALGLFGGFGCNASLAKSLRDADPTVRSLADNALWAVWFRADSVENNEALERVHDLIGRGKLAEAVEQAGRLIDRAPAFAEAHNQRAIALYFQGRFAESVEDCRNVIAHNPYHTGALSGMGQCQLRLGRRDEALRTFRRALEIQPYSEGLREVVAELEADEKGR